jgi:4-carboxymuconolactone decarboxylase
VTRSLPELDDATRVLVQLSAAIAAGSEATVRRWITEAAQSAPASEIEEVVLQSYLFCGFPRALNAAR